MYTKICDMLSTRARSYELFNTLNIRLFQPQWKIVNFHFKVAAYHAQNRAAEPGQLISCIQFTEIVSQDRVDQPTLFKNVHTGGGIRVLLCSSLTVPLICNVVTSLLEFRRHSSKIRFYLLWCYEFMYSESAAPVFLSVCISHILSHVYGVCFESCLFSYFKFLVQVGLLLSTETGSLVRRSQCPALR